MATLGARAIGLSSFPSSSSYLSWNSRANSSSFSCSLSMQMVGKSMISRGNVYCSAVQESSTPTATAETKETAAAEPKPSPTAETKAAAAEEKEAVKAAAPKAAAKPKPKAAAKAPAKKLPEMMVEEVIPPLKTILEAQDDISEIELSFQDNKLEGSFLKKGFPYSFWAFFPDGLLTGPKGFSLSSYGSGASTVEPFLIDEKKITAKHVVFWVEKRLAAQGIIPVWNYE